MKKSIGTLLGAVVLLFTPTLHSATKVWDDGGLGNNNWSAAVNWAGDVAPVGGDSITFPSTLAGNSHNDLAAGTDIAGIILAGTNYIIAGNSIDLSSSLLSSQTTGTNIFSIPLVLATDVLLTVQNAGTFLQINSAGTINTNGFDLIVGGQGAAVINSVISGTGAVVKNGPGFFRLSAANTYSGGTVLNAGATEVTNTSGSATGSGTVSVQNGAELQGDGIITGAVTVEAGGEISPGDDEPALLQVGDLTLEPSSVFIVQLNGPVPGTEYSGLDVVGSVNIAGAIFRIALGPDLVAGDEFVIIDNDSSDDVAGTFNGLSEGETFRVVGIDDIGFKISYSGGDGNDVVLTSIPTLSINDVQVAEPASGTSTVTFVVTLSEDSDETIEVDYGTAAGTATASADYTVATGTLTFSPGTKTQTIQVTIKSDAIDEGNEEFFMNLFSPTNASIAKDEGVATILPPGSVVPNPDPSSNPNPNNPNPGFPTARSDGGCSLSASAPSYSAAWGLGILALAGLWGMRRAKLRA
ncbi:MAG TPA: Calx-beta domain-containing protein [bacterium]|nr:Calx-beta domain-containing protein [bacterium]